MRGQTGAAGTVISQPPPATNRCSSGIQKGSGKVRLGTPWEKSLQASEELDLLASAFGRVGGRSLRGAREVSSEVGSGLGVKLVE